MRSSQNSLAYLSLVLLLLGVCATANAQQSANKATEERDRGIQLFTQGDTQGAILLLRAATKHNKDDISAWHYLGLALAQSGKKDDARKAHEKSAKLADARLSSSLDSVPVASKAELLEGAESADQYLVLSSNPSKKKKQEWQDRADFLRVYALDPQPLGTVYSNKEVTTRVRILSKPEPMYTEDARKHQTTGTVVIRCVFAADAHVRALRVMAGLPNGLTRRAIIAAQRIQFIPATKDGHPVSMWMQLEYNFNLY